MDLSEQQLHIVPENSATMLAVRELWPAFERPTSSFSTRWSGLAGGITPPGWWAADILISGAALELFSTKNAYYIPSAGAVISADGQVFSKTIKQWLYADPELKQLQTIWASRASAPRLAQGIVTMPFGATLNYGHFVLDAMTSVAATAQAIGSQAVFLTPKLQDWQRQHFKLLQIKPVELTRPIYAIDQITFSSGMSGALHAPNAHFQTLRDLQLPGLPIAPNGPRRIYISRRGKKRKLINEDELERVLRHFGFAIILPETLPVAKQIIVFRSAKVIVAPTGAGLANLLYAQKASVFEIIPRDMTLNDYSHKWVAYLTAMGEGDWRPFFCEDLPGHEQAVIAGQKRPGYKPFEIPIDDLVSFIAPVLF